jgi:GAF domain-containing protein
VHDQHETHGHDEQDPRAGSSDDLAVRLSGFARGIEQQDDPHSALHEIVCAAVELVPGSDEGSITLVVGRKTVTSQAANGDLARAVDALQEQTGQGPCLDAVYDQDTVLVPDLAVETRWPLFSDRAVEAGARSMLAFRLYVEGDNLGALNLYARDPMAFGEESERTGALFASHASVAYAAARKQSQLARTVETRQRIGQAQGILMERHRMTDDQAFALLVRVSQRSNTKLRDVADRLVHTGELDSEQDHATR